MNIEKSLFAKPPRQKHDYTSEIELKSLLIRLQNWNLIKEGIEGHKISPEQRARNRKINRYIIVYTKLNGTLEYYNDSKERKLKYNNLKAKLKQYIISKSEITPIDKDSYESFGSILLLMIKNILTKHSFSGYTYKDDFYSDSIHKILKYMKNFNHKLISERTNTEVNAFAYISQIIHNSVIFIIKQKAKEQENIKDVISLEIIYGEIDLKAVHKKGDAVVHPQIEETEKIKIKVESLKETSIKEVVLDILKDIEEDESLKDTMFTVEYPIDHIITFEEYDELKPLLKGNISIVKSIK